MFPLIREATEGDTDALRELFRVCFNKKISQEEWFWKYRETPFGSSSFVAEDNGRIVAHYGGFRLRFYSGGRIIDAIQGCDVMTHPEYRAKVFSKRGIIVRTAEAFFQANHAEFIYGFPSERHGRLKVLQLGFEGYRYINMMKKRIKTRSLNPFIRVHSGWNSISPEDIDRIWNYYKHNLIVSIEKKSDYILWRYRQRPDNNYILLSFKGIFKQELIGYAIVNLEEDKILHILDLLIAGGKMTAKRVITAIENFALKRGINEIDLWINPNDRSFRVFKELGYESQKGIPYIVRIFEGSSISGESFYDNYCYSIGDYDAS